MPQLSVVIPVYQSVECLDELHRRLTRSLKSLRASYEMVWVDDGSLDGGWEAMVRLARKDRRLRILRLSRNFGQHQAITAGLEAATGDWVVVMDCDLQDRPEEIPRLYAKALEGHDLVVASRTGRKDSWFKRLTSRIFYAFFNLLTGMDYDGRVGNFRIFSRKIADQFKAFRERSRYLGPILHWMGYPAERVEVKHDPRFAGRSSYGYARLIRLGFDICLAYTDKPLRLFIGFGFLIVAVSFAVGGWVLYRRFVFGIPIMGWASLMVSIYFLCGTVIAMLGITGIYVSKTFDETKGRPFYVVRDRQNL